MKIKKQFKTQQPISDLKKAKKFAKGEYPKIGGGGLKPDIKKPNKGTTPVKTNVSKVNVDKIFDKPKNPVTKTIGVKQSDVSKKAKEFTAKVNKANVKVQKNFVGRKKNLLNVAF